MKRLLLISALILLALPLHGELRVFKNTKGEEIKAELISATDTHAELKREDGKKYLVPLGSLSDTDRAWITEWRKSHKHYKVAVQASVKKGNTREEKGTAFGGKSRKGNDCWYVIGLKNNSVEVLSGLKVEYIIFAPDNTATPSLCGVCEVAAIPPGKTGQAVTQKLLVDQLQTTYRSGNSSIVQLSENSLAGIHAELFVDGRAGAFVNGKIPADAGDQLKKWREKEHPADKNATPPAKS